MRNLASRHWHDCRDVVVAQGSREVFVVAARRSGVRCDCRVGGRPATASLAFEGGAAAIAPDVCSTLGFSRVRGVTVQLTAPANPIAQPQAYPRCLLIIDKRDS